MCKSCVYKNKATLNLFLLSVCRTWSVFELSLYFTDDYLFQPILFYYRDLENIQYIKYYCCYCIYIICICTSVGNNKKIHCT